MTNDKREILRQLIQEIWNVPTSIEVSRSVTWSDVTFCYSISGSPIPSTTRYRALPGIEHYPVLPAS
eukprot:1334479-Amorphochlora_amoeboformis.AAC.1